MEKGGGEYFTGKCGGFCRRGDLSAREDFSGGFRQGGLPVPAGGFTSGEDFAGGKPKKKGVPKLIEFALLPLWNQRNTDGLFLISRKHNFLYKIA